MDRETFWNNLERAYADEDNARFDIKKRKDRLLRKEKLEKILVMGIVVVIFATFLVYGFYIFNRMSV